MYMLLDLLYLYIYGDISICSVTQSCPTLCNPMDSSPPGSPVHGIPQTRILEWVSLPFSRASSWHRDRTWVFCIGGRFFTIWATREASKNTGVGCHFLLQGISPTQGTVCKVKKKKEAYLLQKETYKNTKDREPNFDLFPENLWGNFPFRVIWMALLCHCDVFYGVELCAVFSSFFSPPWSVYIFFSQWDSWNTRGCGYEVTASYKSLVFFFFPLS